MNLYLMTPHIIKESSEGTTYCPVQDELFTNRRSIEVVGEINRESVYSLILQLRYRWFLRLSGDGSAGSWEAVTGCCMPWWLSWRWIM